jgi:uncharacterized membrane protein YidH (DUF202 family)
LNEAPFHDPGLATERTQLAWQRSALAVAVIGLLCLRAGLAGEKSVAGFAFAFVLGALAVAMEVIGPRLDRRRAAHLALAASMVAAVGALVLTLS